MEAVYPRYRYCDVCCHPLGKEGANGDHLRLHDGRELWVCSDHGDAIVNAFCVKPWNQCPDCQAWTQHHFWDADREICTSCAGEEARDEYEKSKHGRPVEDATAEERATWRKA